MAATIVKLSKRTEFGLDAIASLVVDGINEAPKFFVSETEQTISMTYEVRLKNHRRAFFSKVFTVKLGRSVDNPQLHTDSKQRFLKLYKLAEAYYAARVEHYQALKAA